MQTFHYIDMWVMFLCLTYTICWFWFLLHFIFLLNYWGFFWLSHGLYRYHILLEWFSSYWFEIRMGFTHKCLSFPKSLILPSLLQFCLCPQTIHSEDISETFLQVFFFFFFSSFFLFFQMTNLITLLSSFFPTLHFLWKFTSLTNCHRPERKTSTCAIF